MGPFLRGRTSLTQAGGYPTGLAEALTAGLWFEILPTCSSFSPRPLSWGLTVSDACPGLLRSPARYPSQAFPTQRSFWTSNLVLLSLLGSLEPTQVMLGTVLGSRNLGLPARTHSKGKAAQW